MQIDFPALEAAWPAACSNPRIAHITPCGYTLPRLQKDI